MSLPLICVPFVFSYRIHKLTWHESCLIGGHDLALEGGQLTLVACGSVRDPAIDVVDGAKDTEEAREKDHDVAHRAVHKVLTDSPAWVGI